MNQQIATIDDFKLQIHSPQVQENLRGFLPKGPEGDAAMEKFTAVTIRAVQEDDDLLKADRKTLFLACQRATQDGLMPDKREGALVIYNTNVGTKQDPQWIKKVQWQPMIQGIRKKLAQAGWDIRAEIVYEKDEFDFELGDTPRIVHRPKAFGDRGPIVGAYAIATELATGEKWRETMDLEQLEAVRLSSKQASGSVWTKWRTEMYRKTVAKRLRKYLPISDDSVLDLIDRDNEQFDMNKPAEPSKTAQKVQEAVRAAAAPEPEPEPIEGELEPEKRKNVRKARTPEEVETENPAPPEEDETDPLGFD